MATRYLLVSTFVLLYISFMVFGQASEDKVKLIKERPAVEIAFDCAGKRDPWREGESSQGTWLTLQNNLKWQLKVPGSYIESNYAWKKGQSEALLFYFMKSKITEVVLLGADCGMFRSQRTSEFRLHQSVIA